MSSEKKYKLEIEMIKGISWHTAFKSMRLRLKVACMIGLSGTQSKVWNRTVPIFHALWWCSTICETLLVTPRELARIAYMVQGGKRTHPQCRRHKRQRFYPWVEKITWGRKWQPTSVFLPEKSHGQRSLAGYSPKGCGVGHGWGIQQQQLILKELTDQNSVCLCGSSELPRLQYKIKEEMVGSRIMQETKNSWVKSVLKDDWL